MKKALIAVLANATVAGLLAAAASPAKADDGPGIVVMGGTVVMGQPAYDGRPVYAADVAEPSPYYGRPAYVVEPPPPRYDRPAYMVEPPRPRAYVGEPSPPHYGGPVYATEPSSPPRYYGPTYTAEPAPPPSPCYWHRQRYWDGYGWTVRPTRVCD